MTNQEINEKLARLKFPDQADDWITANAVANDYSTDLNLLMPLAWKYGIELVKASVTEYQSHVYDDDNDAYLYQTDFHKDPIKAIIQCLLKIAEEG